MCIRDSTETQENLIALLSYLLERRLQRVTQMSNQILGNLEQMLAQPAFNHSNNGLSAAQLDASLLTLEYRVEEKNACSICLEEFSVGETVAALPCHHPCTLR
eukprot:TRINITY_DN24274_c0_g1_i1.p1 TRINITY_DN24274_c0_g1~~TRINITY_DN24274_c0_g1_i1.p1  ORF type:complete len:103 (+),score=17.82 TRINITY_DN24274_c0_g1_i1:64-372(+)